MTQFLRKSFSVFPPNTDIDPATCGHHRAIAPWVNNKGECVQCGAMLKPAAQTSTDAGSRPGAV